MDCLRVCRVIWKITSVLPQCSYLFFTSQLPLYWQDQTPALRCEAPVGQTIVPESEESCWLNDSHSSVQGQHGKRVCIGHRLLGHSRCSGYQIQRACGGHTQEWPLASQVGTSTRSPTGNMESSRLWKTGRWLWSSSASSFLLSGSYLSCCVWDMILLLHRGSTLCQLKDFKWKPNRTWILH